MNFYIWFHKAFTGLKYTFVDMNPCKPKNLQISKSFNQVAKQCPSMSKDCVINEIFRIYWIFEDF